MATIIHGDCLEWLRVTHAAGVGVDYDKKFIKTMFADIPDNIGMKYHGYDDGQMDRYSYYNWVKLLLLESLHRCGIFWLSYNPVHELEITSIIRDVLKFRHPQFEYNKFVWTYTFSQYNDHDCSQGYRPIVRLKSTSKRYGVIYPDAIRETSVRQQLGDARAAGEKVPSNVWSIPRVVGNSPERCDHMPTQHPIRLMERIIAFSCNGIDEKFVDLFGGSGSSIIAAQNLDMARALDDRSEGGYFDNTSVVELDMFSCEMIKNHKLLKKAWLERLKVLEVGEQT